MAARLPPVPREPIAETFPWRDWLTKLQAYVSGGIPGLGTVTSVATGTGLTGGPITNTGTVSLANQIAAGGPTGSATVAPIITYNAQGQLTTVSSATVTPAVGSVTGLGTGVATALGVNVGTAGSPVVNGGALGTPSGGVATNLTGTAASLTAGLVTNGVYTTGAGTVYLTPSGSAASLTSFPTFNQDTTGKSAKTDALNSATTVVNVSAATAPSNGQVLTATDSTHATWVTPITTVDPRLMAFLAAHG